LDGFGFAGSVNKCPPPKTKKRKEKKQRLGNDAKGGARTPDAPSNETRQDKMSASSDCAASRVAARPELWALIAEHSGLVGAWRLMRVCKAARVGAKEFLSTLPGLVVCGGSSVGEDVRDDVWRLYLVTLRWGTMPGLVTARDMHACCSVRGNLVVFSGGIPDGSLTSSVERLSLLSSEEGAFVDLPPLSCGGIWGAAAIAVEESDSAAGQVLLLGGVMEEDGLVSTVHLVDLATGVCTPGRPGMLRSRYHFAAAGLPEGRIVCAGGYNSDQQSSAAEMWGAPVQGEPDAAWTWRQLPAMSVGRYSCRGCVMSDGRFAVLGGSGDGFNSIVTCEALAIGGGDEDWVPLSPMHSSRDSFACAAVAGCIIVAGGWGRKSAEVYDEALDRWLRLPFDLPHDDGLALMGSALL
jgi:hypothetical protein